MVTTTSTVVPSAIIMINSGLSDVILNYLIKQLFIDRVISIEDLDILNDGYVSDLLDGYDTFVDYIRKNNLRVMITVNYQNLENRDLVDVAIYVKNGLVAILENKFGPHGLTYPVQALSWDKLGIEEANRSVF